MGEKVEGLLHSGVARAARVTGGDVSVAYRVVLDDSRTVFVKTHRSAPAHFFDTESVGLQWLRTAAAHDGLLSVPDVLAVTDDLLVLDWIIDADGPAGRRTDVEFGADSPDSTADPGRVSGATTVAPPAAEHCRTSRAPPGPSSTQPGVCSPWRASPAIRTLSALIRSGASKPSPDRSTASEDPTNPRCCCTATCGRATDSSTPRDGTG